MTLRRGIATMAAWAALASGGIVHADEGMWVFNNLPLEQLKQRYGFEPTPEWDRALRSSAVRFNNGGSGSFVSADGLVMTNHHVGADTLQKISTPRRITTRTGFLARTRAEEVKAPDLELNVLVGIEDVTDRVNAGRHRGDGRRRGQRRPPPGDGRDREGVAGEDGPAQRRRHALPGGQYALYTYKRYTDVRLVMAPEFDIAFFGGDPDNFEYPRYDLDVCFFRAYEDGTPARVAHHLSWSAAGSREGDLVFVAGHPGRTSRLNTVGPPGVPPRPRLPLPARLPPREGGVLLEYGRKGPEQFRQSKEDLFGVQNSRKARIGGLEGLRDEDFMGRKARAERALRDRIAADPAAEDIRRGLGQDCPAQAGARPRSSSPTTSWSGAWPSSVLGGGGGGGFF
jgi:hypothetical protein